MLCAFGQRVAMCCGVLGVVGSKFEKGQMSQQHPTCRDKVGKHTRHVAPNNVAICYVACCDRFEGALQNVFTRPHGSHVGAPKQ